MKIYTLLLTSIILLFSIQSNYSQGNTTYDSEMKRLAKDVSGIVKENKKINVAVWYFKNSFRKKEELGHYIAQEFSVYFSDVKDGFDVISRDELDQILDEHKLNSQGFIDPKTAKEINMIIHADAIITGTIDLSFRSLRLRVKLIDTQTGKIIKAVMRNIPKDENIKYILHETGVNEVKNIDKNRRRLNNGERYGTPEYVNANCETLNIGDYCFENDTDINYKITIQSNNNYRNSITKKISVLAGQSMCFTDLSDGVYSYSLKKFYPGKYTTMNTSLIEGLFKVESCKSIIYRISKIKTTNINRISNTPSQKTDKKGISFGDIIKATEPFLKNKN